MTTDLPYFLVYRGIAGPDGRLVDVTDGFNSHDYLDGWSEIGFDSETAARAWMDANHKGPDGAGYTAKFHIVKREG